MDAAYTRTFTVLHGKSVYKDIKEIVAPEIDPKSFGTFEKQAPAPLLGPPVPYGFFVFFHSLSS